MSLDLLAAAASPDGGRVETQLDHRLPSMPGYFAGSKWPVECGGNRRQKIVASAGLRLSPGERLTSISRPSGGWAVMASELGPQTDRHVF